MALSPRGNVLRSRQPFPRVVCRGATPRAFICRRFSPCEEPGSTHEAQMDRAGKNEHQRQGENINMSNEDNVKIHVGGALVCWSRQLVRWHPMAGPFNSGSTHMEFALQTR